MNGKGPSGKEPRSDVPAASPLSDPSWSDEDRRLFEEEIRGVRPLATGHSRVVPDFDRPGPEAPKLPKPKAPTHEMQVEVQGDSICGRAYGVALELAHALARGEPPPEARLDLHHMNAESARQRSVRFIEQAAADRRRCVLIIHGRGLRSGLGGPVLRDVVVEALGHKPAADHVLAFSSAPPRHGGVGAMLVLLRRPPRGDRG